MQRERRSQVEPRCEERWHLRDDEQFDLAAWFPSLSKATASLFSGAVVLFYLDVTLSVELFLISPFGGSNEVYELHYFTTHFHLIVRMHDKLRCSIRIDKALTIVVKFHLKTK